MKQIKAYRCDFCGKIVKTKAWMEEHELYCFKNPASKSCITCVSLGHCVTVDGRELTEQETLISQFKVEGTYHLVAYPDGDFEIPQNELNDKFKYLENTDIDNYCKDQQCRLHKLRTECKFHEQIK